MKSLLYTMAVLEALTAITLMLAPSLTTSILLGATPDNALALTVTRVAAIALFALAITCWFSRNNDGASGVAKAMFVYNLAVAGLLAKVGVAGELTSIGLWPTALLHTAIAIWCAVELRKIKTK